MADGTDAVNLSSVSCVCTTTAVISLIGCQFVGAGIDGYGFPVGRDTANSRLMGPDRIRCAAIGFALSCVEDIDNFHRAVTIPIVVAEVEVGICLVDGFFYHGTCILVVPIIVVFPIIGILIGKCIRPCHIEIEFKDTIALRKEIIFHTTIKWFHIKSLLVDDFRV